MIVGFGCKAGMFPLNAWLTSAHPIAPSPASAVLSGVITKMGVFAVIRATYYVVGAGFLYGTWAQTALIALACISVLIGSVLAYRTDHLKKRLAYSTISQVSYILLGVFLLNATALKGALLHVVFHALMKTVLFLSAGAMIFKTRRVRVSEMRASARRCR
jgi:multicomponent Na+:H+ antiporter subunit D